MLEKLKQEYEKQKKITEQNKADPGRPEAKRQARLGGLMMVVLGGALGGGCYYVYATDGTIYPVLIAAAAAFVGLGLVALLLGRIPGAKRR